MTLLEIWKSMNTRRWHTNSELCHTVDPVGSHSARMCLLAYKLRPDLVNKDFLLAALTHDMGEFKVGDLPYPFKVAHPEVWKEVEVIENGYINDAQIIFSVNEVQKRLLKLTDRLDCFMWVYLNRPDLIASGDWEDDFTRLLDDASNLGIFNKIEGLFDGR